MNIVRSSLAVFVFECRRSLTPSRISCWLVLVLFPPTIFGLLAYYQRDESISEEVWVGLLFSTIPGVISLLGLLLWATPAVYTELEGKTWIYLAVRPSGKDAVMLGKYFAAVVWSAAAAWLGLTLSMAVVAPQYDEPVKLWLVLSVLVLLSCMSYGALYCCLGVLFRKKAMAIALSYTLIFEFVISFVPALVNKFTVLYRLRTLVAQWLEWGLEFQEVGTIGSGPAWQHILILMVYTVVMLIAASYLLHMREHITAEET